ncbi:putative iron reductase domain protein [Hypoxylon sp. NC1633]|nr:putative iron reductase domain protein [Hypoxylon sp. NC1633]
MRASHMLSRLGLASSTVFSLFIASSQAQDASNTSSNTTAGSVFITPTRDLAFALNVPSDSTNDLFFSLMLPTGVSWGSIGLGSDVMEGALMLLVYPSADGKNATVSARHCTGHTEPVYAPEIEIEALSGTGFNNDTYIFNGRCGNCRSWSDGTGKVDVVSKSQNMLYATGERGNYLKSDALDAPLKYHYNYGTFTLDMVRATGPGGVPTIDRSVNSESVGAVQGLSQEAAMDAGAVAHAVIMVLAFIGLYPLGVFVLRFGNWVRWHGINQGIAVLLTIMGSGLGFSISKHYNRSKNFNTAHQVIGILIFIFIFAQFGLGYFHHRTFKRTQQTTKLAPIHVWMGRLILVLGVVNSFLGFPLALSSQYNYVLTGLVLFIFPGMILVMLMKRFIQRRWNQRKGAAAEPNGYNMEPWQQSQSQATYNATAPAGQNASMPGMSSYAPPYQPQGVKAAELGPKQNTREYV